MSAPKLFISYSWSTPAREQWVLQFATEMRESGIDVILDKWDLKEGHDAIAFMEQMVTDPEVKKVVMVCDRTYAEKADGRMGGVGTETQIISREVYEKQDQSKFVAVVVEKDEDGKACLPTYYKSRIYIDLSENDKYGENFERLLKWAFDKPLYIKPELGNRPTFLEEGEHPSLGTTASFNRAIDALRNMKPNASALLEGYLNTFVSNLERFRIDPQNLRGNEFDDAIIKSIEEFLPFRNEAIQLFVTLCQFSPSEEHLEKLHRFFEGLLPYMDKPVGVTSWRESDFDNFVFIVHELFLYAIAVFIRFERFSQANSLLQDLYYLPSRADYGKVPMVDYSLFCRPMESLRYRNSRLKLNRLSIRADLLKERCAGIPLEFNHVMQADFVLYLRDAIASLTTEEKYQRWWPETLIYISRYPVPFEIFARSVSNKYFERTKVLLGIQGTSDLNPLAEAFRSGSLRAPRCGPGGIEQIDPLALIGYDQLATTP